MSAIFSQEFEEDGLRKIGLITILPGRVLQPVVTAFLKTEAGSLVNDVDLSRDESTGVPAFEVAVTVKLDSRTPTEVMVEIFGNDFLDKHLPITDQNEMRSGDAFLRIGSCILEGHHPTNAELFIINEMIHKNGTHLLGRQVRCMTAFENSNLAMELNDRALQVGDSAAEVPNVGKIATSCKMDGGSWLLIPYNGTGRRMSPDKKGQLCMNAFTKIAIEFFEGSLQEEFISKVSYTPVKGVVKVTNEKTKYFEFVELQNPISDEDRFLADTQVKSVFLKVVGMQFENVELKYKPEIFTVWKLTTDKTRAKLSIYSGIPFEKKKELASAC